MDTIYALSTARGKAGVAVVRVSGPAAADAVRKIARGLPPPRRAAVRRLSDAQGEFLDTGIVLYFEDGSSYTGESVAEFHIHGSRAVVAALTRELESLPGTRPAEPGEFTLRALRSGRIDPTQVEGLGDLLDAETEAQRRQATRTFGGALRTKTEEWRESLLRCVALLESELDFADEDLPVDSVPEALGLISERISELGREAAGVGAAERIRDGFEVAIVGAPNTGKSTLLNHLAGREAAITSEHAGTTRDVIEVRMDVSGLPVTLLDTAGLRDSADPVEAVGVKRARDRAAQADLRVFLHEEEGVAGLGVAPRRGDLVLRAKADLLPVGKRGAVSGKTGMGVEEMIARIAAELEVRAARAGVATRERHRAALLEAVSALESGESELLGENPKIEIAAEEVWRAIRALEALVGRVDIEHVLGEIFSRFCIGK